MKIVWTFLVSLHPGMIRLRFEEEEDISFGHLDLPRQQTTRLEDEKKRETTETVWTSLDPLRRKTTGEQLEEEEDDHLMELVS